MVGEQRAHSKSWGQTVSTTVVEVFGVGTSGEAPPEPNTGSWLTSLGAFFLRLPIGTSNHRVSLTEAELEAVSTASTNSGLGARDAVLPEVATDVRIVELYRRMGLTWEELASLFGVDRRSLHLWASGRRLSEEHAEHLRMVERVMERCDRGTRAQNREWLLAGKGDGAPINLMRRGHFDEIATPPSLAMPQVRHRPGPAISAEARRARRGPRPVDLLDARHEPEGIGDVRDGVEGAGEDGGRKV